MKNLKFLCVLLWLAIPANTARGAEKRRVACKTPANAATCYWTHGRLSLYNGTSSFRIWKVGTTRMLGIYSGPSVYRPDADVKDLDDNEGPEWPSNIDRAFRPTENHMFADFEVCPLGPEKLRAMQAVCIESAKNIVLKK